MSDLRNSPVIPDNADEDRRKFLASCGKFAVVTPPAVTLLLSTSLHSSAIAQSGGGHHDPSGYRGSDCDEHGYRNARWGGYRSAGRDHHHRG